MEADPYATLGVLSDDGASAIRGAFLDLVRRFHPVTDGVSPFLRAVTEAYGLFEHGPRRPGHELPAPPAAPGVHHIDLLEDFEDGQPSRDEIWALFRMNFTAAGPPKSGRIDVLDLAIRAPQATVVVLDVPVFHPCPACHGVGKNSLHACPACDASGVAEERAPVPLVVGLEEDVIVVALDALAVRTPALRVRAVRSPA